MNSRTALIGATVIVGLVCGPAVSQGFSGIQSAIPWSGLLLVFVGCALGLPLVLAFLATSGKYKTMVRLWSFFGLLAILLAAVGISAAVQSIATASGVESSSFFFIVAGAGLFAGLSAVKLAIRRARSDGA